MSPGRALASLGGGLALLAVVTAWPPGAVGRTSAPGAGPGVAELSAALASGEALVDAVTLGGWIRDRRPGLAVVDVRDSTGFLQYSIPTAVNLRFRELAGSLGPEREIVLYDDGGGDAARAWLLLRRLGHPRVRVLEGGLLGWVDGVMSPVLPAHSPAQKRRFDEIAAVSRYFGGVPRVGIPGPAAADPDATRDAVRLLTRRGCY